MPAVRPVNRKRVSFSLNGSSGYQVDPSIEYSTTNVSSVVLLSVQITSITLVDSAVAVRFVGAVRPGGGTDVLVAVLVAVGDTGGILVSVGGILVSVGGTSDVLVDVGNTTDVLVAVGVLVDVGVIVAVGVLVAVGVSVGVFVAVSVGVLVSCFFGLGSVVAAGSRVASTPTTIAMMTRLAANRRIMARFPYD